MHDEQPPDQSFVELKLTKERLASLIAAIHLIRTTPSMRLQLVKAIQAETPPEKAEAITVKLLEHALKAEGPVAEHQGCDAKGIYTVRYLRILRPHLLALLKVVAEVMREHHSYGAAVLSSIMRKVEESLTTPTEQGKSET